MQIAEWLFFIFFCVPIGIGLLFTIVFVIQDLMDIYKDYLETKNE